MVYSDIFTVTKSVAGFPSRPMHESENVVGPESGTVDAPPESVFSLKLPSGLVTVHDETFFVFQNTDVRDPIGTEAGTAQISTIPAGPPRTAVVVDATVIVVVAVFLTTGVFTLVPVRGDDVTGTTGAAAFVEYPLHSHNESKNVAGITYEIIPDHGRAWHRREASPVDESDPVFVYP